MDNRLRNNIFLKTVCFCFALCIIGILMSSSAAQAAAKPNNPKFSVKAGTYYVSSYKSVKLSCTTDGAKIFYSTDGKNYSEYNKAVKLTKSSTLYAYSVLNGVKSDVVSKKYKLKVRLSSVAPGAGEYDGAQIVKISTKAKNVTIYYTLDGTKPTTKSTKYTSAGIEISETGKLRLLIRKSGFTNRYKTYEYVINSPVAQAADDEQDNTSGSDAGEYVIPTVQLPSSGNISEYKFTDGYDIYGKKFSDRVYYSLMNSNEKKAYELIYKACVHHFDSVNISTAALSSDNAFRVYEYVISESPELFWVNDGNISSAGEPVVNLFLQYTNSVDEQNSRFKKIESIAEDVVNEAGKKEDLYGKVMYLHDWITDKAVYNNDYSSTRNLAGTDDIMIDGKGLCTAYARAFMYLCHKSGIECVMVNGRADNGYGIEDHSWNKLKLDGKWYAMDVTWDDPVYATGTVVTDSMRTYSYFCLSDKYMGKDHVLSDTFKLASVECNSDDYSYASHNKLQEFDNVAEAFEYFNMHADANYNEGVKRTEVCCTSNDVVIELFNFMARNRINTNHGYTYGYSGNYVYIEITD